MDKDTLRKELKARIRGFGDKRKESEWILRKLADDEEYRNADVILAFCPLRSEPDITPILSDERVLLPYVEDGRMKFSSSKKLVESPLGFLEPVEKTEASYDKALMIVPMLGFDDSGMRLGRGGGFYDRYIAENRGRLTTIGVAFSVSRVKEIPAEWNDMRLDRIIHL